MMVQATNDKYRFDLGSTQYKKVRWLGLIFLCTLLLCTGIGVVAGALLWRTYTHNFTPYLKWQDALVALSWFISLTAIGGSLLTVRFLYALHAGYTEGMVTFEGEDTVTVRDLSPENLKSIFWIMNSAFWCFLVALVGLTPLILIEWTLQISSQPLAIISTALAVLLSIAGVIVSIIAASFIVIGWTGGVSFCCKLGSSHMYKLNGQATIRIDNFVLTIIYPGNPESMVDLNLLTINNQKHLLELLHRRWVAAEQVWNPMLGDEIAQALEEAELQMMVA